MNGINVDLLRLATATASKTRAVAAAGGVTKLAEAIGVTRSAVSQWPRVPAARVLDVERASGVPRHELRPDIYPPPDSGAA